MLTNTKLRIVQLFTANITTSFSIRQVSRELKTNYSLVHRAIRQLIDKQKVLKETERGKIILNFREHHNTLAYAEYERRDDFLKKPKNITLKLFLDSFIKKFKEESFILLIFGSTVNSSKPRDLDLLLIVDSTEKTENSEVLLYNTARNHALENKAHITCISYESVYEMLAKRDQRNVMNEVLNKHLLIHGAELFYRLLDRGRQ